MVAQARGPLLCERARADGLQLGARESLVVARARKNALVLGRTEVNPQKAPSSKFLSRRYRSLNNVGLGQQDQSRRQGEAVQQTR